MTAAGQEPRIQVSEAPEPVVADFSAVANQPYSVRFRQTRARIHFLEGRKLRQCCKRGGSFRYAVGSSGRRTPEDRCRGVVGGRHDNAHHPALHQREHAVYTLEPEMRGQLSDDLGGVLAVGDSLMIGLVAVGGDRRAGTIIDRRVQQ